MAKLNGKLVSRPDHLPDFKNPPLNEVVLGVQFNSVEGYQQVYARDVWRLFEKQFPKIEEHQALAPTFETFGKPTTPRLNVGFHTGATHDRFWFITEDADQLIQFQNDRIHHNWRKRDIESNEYPRFENIIQKFSKELNSIDGYFYEHFGSNLDIVQSEVTYINHIETDEEYNFDYWFNFLKFKDDVPDDISCSFRKVLRKPDGTPYARFICDAGSAIGKKDTPIITLNLTVRGTPDEPNINSALNFLKSSRDIIVLNFATLTTDSAHERWERVK